MEAGVQAWEDSMGVNQNVTFYLLFIKTLYKPENMLVPFGMVSKNLETYINIAQAQWRTVN